MELFHELISTRFQTLIDLLLLGTRQPCLTKEDLEEVFRRNHIHRNGTEEIRYWESLRLLVPGPRKGTYRLGEEINPSEPWLPPISTLEESYLDRCLRLPEAKAFSLSPRSSSAPSGPDFIRERGGGAKQPLPQPEILQIVLQAIGERRKLRYTYRTRQSPEPREDEQIPFRVEHQVFDRRWWLILYLPDQQRTVKVPLGHILSARLGPPHQVPDGEIQDVIRRRYLAQERVTLLIRDKHNALERAFLTLGQNPKLSACSLGDGQVRMSFDWYRYDREELVREFLYLGEYVSLQEPEELRRCLADRLRQAIARQGADSPQA